MFSIVSISKPQILLAENDFLLVYKPPRMHTSPQAHSPCETLLDWCAVRFPEIMDLSGRQAGEGGLLHRLDYETHGLMLIARNTGGMTALLEQQGEGKIIKEYSAVAAKSQVLLPGFPVESPIMEDLSQRELKWHKELKDKLIIQSAFRPFGPGRKAVRPVLIDNAGTEKPGKLYTTEILESRQTSAGDLPFQFSFRLRISKGFRHQIRSHLAWLGLPIINDSLYGGLAFGNAFLALRASSLSFNDPSSGKGMSYSIPQLELSEIL